MYFVIESKRKKLTSHNQNQCHFKGEKPHADLASTNKPNIGLPGK